MKKTLILAALLMAGQTLLAQGSSPYSLKRLRFGVEPTFDIWLMAPSNIDLKLLQRGGSAHLMYDQPIKETNFSISGGLSIASHNLYSNGLLKLNTSGASYLDPIASTVTYRKNKLSVTYLEIPIEAGYKTNSHINFALGVRGGFLINSHTKYTGDDYLTTHVREIKVKFLNNENIMSYRLGAYAVLGYRWANVKVGYNFTTVFEKDKGPKLYPMTIGLLLRPY